MNGAAKGARLHAPKTLSFIPGDSVIDLKMKFGSLYGSLIRHWYAPGGAQWAPHYDFVLRTTPTPVVGTAVVAVIAVDRITVARLLVADRIGAARESAAV